MSRGEYVIGENVRVGIYPEGKMSYTRAIHRGTTVSEEKTCINIRLHYYKALYYRPYSMSITVTLNHSLYLPVI